jgi:Protease inhibitor Inh
MSGTEGDISMKSSVFAAGLAAAILMSGPAPAQNTPATAERDQMAGKPLALSDAAGPWTLEKDGMSLCVITLGREKVAQGYRLSAGDSCQHALPAMPTAWTPTDHGMKFVDSGGQTVMTFGRWSDSLLVSPLHGEQSLQLRRGG